MSDIRMTSYQNKIIDVLKEHEQNKEKEIGITLKNLIKETHLNKDNIRSPLASLLNKGEIKISGFAKSKKFNIDNIYFERRMPHKTVNDILKLLYELENPEKMMNSYNELLNLFINKIKEYEEQEMNYWNELNFKINSIPLEDAIKELENELEEEGNPMIIQPETTDQAGRYIGSKTNHLIKLLEIYSGWYEKNKNAKLWYFNELSQEDITKHLKIENNKSGVSKRYTTRQLAQIINLRSIPEIDVEGSWTPEDFLKEKNFVKPESRSIIDVKRMFREIIFYINSFETNRFLKNTFSIALSGEKESIEFFEQFIKDISYISILKERLSEELNLKPNDENDPYVRNAKVHEEFKKLGQRFS